MPDTMSLNYLTYHKYTPAAITLTWTEPFRITRQSLFFVYRINDVYSETDQLRTT